MLPKISRCSYYLQMGWCVWGPSTQKGQYQKDSDRSCFKCEYFPQIMNYFRNGFAYAPRLIDFMFKMFQRRTQFHHHSPAVQTAAPPTPCPPPPRSASSISSSRCFSSFSTTSTSNPLTGASTCQIRRGLSTKNFNSRKHEQSQPPSCFSITVPRLQREAKKKKATLSRKGGLLEQYLLKSVTCPEIEAIFRF